MKTIMEQENWQKSWNFVISLVILPNLGDEVKCVVVQLPLEWSVPKKIFFTKFVSFFC